MSSGFTQDELRRQAKSLMFGYLYGRRGSDLDAAISDVIINGERATVGRVVQPIPVATITRQDIVSETAELEECLCGTWAVGEHCPPPSMALAVIKKE